MTEPISKISASSTTAKNSVTAIVDAHGIPQGVEVEINGVGISLPIEQFSSAHSTMSHPKAVWVDGHTRREIFVDHVKKTSYVRSIPNNAPAQESIQVVETVVVHMESGAKAAGGVTPKPKEEPKKETPASPAENIVKGGLNVDTPKTEETPATTVPHAGEVHAKPDVQTPVANTVFTSGVFCVVTDDETRHTAGSSPSFGNDDSLMMNSPAFHLATGPTTVRDNHGEDRVGTLGATYTHSYTPSPLFSGAVHVWGCHPTEDGETNRPSHVNPNGGSNPLNPDMTPVSARSHALRHDGSVSVGGANDCGSDGHRGNPLAAIEGTPSRPNTHSIQPDTPPVIGGDDSVRVHVGAPVAPPPVAILTILVAPKLPAIKDSPSVERPTPSPDSEGEGRDHHEERGGQQHPRDEQPTPEEQ